MTEITDKVRAILRKADESTNDSEEERDVAMRMAQRLLLKHGLTMADVKDISDADGIEGREFMREFTGVETEAEESWRGNLLHGIGEVYFCKVYYHTIAGGRKHREWMIVGRADHVAMTKSMYEFVMPQLQYAFDRATSKMHTYQRDARKYALAACGVPEFLWTSEVTDTTDEELAEIGRSHFELIRETQGGEAAIASIREVLRCSYNYAKHIRVHIRKADIAPSVVADLGVWRRSWFDYATVQIRNRLRELRREEAANLSGGTDLVVSEDKALERELDRLDLGLHRKKNNRKTDRQGAAAGVRAANEADLSGHSKLGGNRKLLGT